MERHTQKLQAKATVFIGQVLQTVTVFLKQVENGLIEVHLVIITLNSLFTTILLFNISKSSNSDVLYSFKIC